MDAARSQLITNIQSTRSPTPPPLDFGFLAPPRQPGELGRLGPYCVQRVLGRGGMGIVFLAIDPYLQRRVALKVMLPDTASKPISRERFLREARAAALIEDDNIIPIFQIGEDRGVLFIAMPYLKGMNLEDYLATRGELTISQSLKIGRETASGLAAAHAKGLIHRDIKPANLFLDARAKGRVKILDFGLALLEYGDERLTVEGAILGTPAFMSPEQAAGLPVTPAADLFSLGAILYRLVTGRRPFTGIGPYAALASLATQTPVPVQELNPKVSRSYAELINRLLEKDPAHRMSSAADLVTALTRIERERKREKEIVRAFSPGIGVQLFDDGSDVQFQFDKSNDRLTVLRQRPIWLWSMIGLLVLLSVLGTLLFNLFWRVA